MEIVLVTVNVELEANYRCYRSLAIAHKQAKHLALKPIDRINLLNWRSITGPTGHRLLLISEPSISALKPIDRINLRLVHHELYCTI